MQESTNKKCPLSNFNECIKNDCAFYLETNNITATYPEGEKKEIDGNIFELICGQPTCSIRIIGFSSAAKHLGLKFGSNSE